MKLQYFQRSSWTHFLTDILDGNQENESLT